MSIKLANFSLLIHDDQINHKYQRKIMNKEGRKLINLNAIESSIKKIISREMKKVFVNRDSNPGQLLGRQLS